jgi:hypothetical protein
LYGAIEWIAAWVLKSLLRRSPPEAASVLQAGSLISD